MGLIGMGLVGIIGVCGFSSLVGWFVSLLGMGLVGFIDVCGFAILVGRFVGLFACIWGSSVIFCSCVGCSTGFAVDFEEMPLGLGCPELVAKYGKTCWILAPLSVLLM
mgnify:FL=1